MNTIIAESSTSAGALISIFDMLKDERISRSTDPFRRPPFPLQSEDFTDAQLDEWCDRCNEIEALVSGIRDAAMRVYRNAVSEPIIAFDDGVEHSKEVLEIVKEELELDVLKYIRDFVVASGSVNIDDEKLSVLLREHFSFRAIERHDTCILRFRYGKAALQLSSDLMWMPGLSSADQDLRKALTAHVAGQKGMIVKSGYIIKTRSSEDFDGESGWG